MSKRTHVMVLLAGLVMSACGTTSGGMGVMEPGLDAVGSDDLTENAGQDLAEPGDDVATRKPDVPEPEFDPDEVPFPVVDTGQDRCFDDHVEIACDAASAFPGQDAQYHSFQPTFVDNGDGTVTDLVTGLMWQQDPGVVKMTHGEAEAAAADFDLAGYNDWRLPSIKELYTLIDFKGITSQSADDSVPYIDTDYFVFRYGDEDNGERFIDAQYATSTLYVSTTMDGNATMFGVNFADGRIKGYGTDDIPGRGEKTFFVMYVRGSVYGENDFIEQGDGTVLDKATGLTWQQDDDGVTRDWAEALAYCEGLTLAGAGDWRLPNAKELQGIVDYTRSPDTTNSAAIDPLFGASIVADPEGGDNFGCYWTNTTHLDGLPLGARAAYVAFGRALGYMEQPPESGNFVLMDVHGAGAQRSDPKSGDPADFPIGNGPQGDIQGIDNLVRCVRGGGVNFANVEPTSYLPRTGRERTGDCGDGECLPGEEESCPEDCGGEGPVACDSAADCDAAGACPAEAALGCDCVPDPMGEKMCVPMCDTDADCPAPPGVTLSCSPEGICIPDGGRRPPR